ncbi:YolD-like family protein [Oceanobacillus neutriphilus]|uniref:YolD-like protein n=1 Tax=Oceanobacillus neutriphilus TaxID=531815 RepID=A0ABQ2NZB4_9BACI|nr:YolD-like family protein [Oceanobacillus neutriphilus]GGP14214.1 hypothetical protein GCM10011346_37420 [Oceanobacillus neutriphilus]
MEKPALDFDQIELKGIRISDAYEWGTEVQIKYFNDNEFKEITCKIDEPINIWDMIIKCSNSDGKLEIPFNWIIQVESV